MTAIVKIAKELDEDLHPASTQKAIDRALTGKWISGDEKNAILEAAASTLKVLRNECDNLRQKAASEPVVAS